MLALLLMVLMIAYWHCAARATCSAPFSCMMLSRNTMAAFLHIIFMLASAIAILLRVVTSTTIYTYSFIN